ncbi:MAG: hypothetical protein ACTSYS_03985 [Promethearchaeota archaeon]
MLTCTIFFLSLLSLPGNFFLPGSFGDAGHVQGRFSEITSSDAKVDPFTGEILDAPANLTAIVASAQELEFKGLNISIDWFRSEWGRIFNSENDSEPLRLIEANMSLPNGGLNSSERDLLNNSLLIGNAKELIGFSWPAPENKTQILLVPWKNSTFGNGWALYAGSEVQTSRAVAFYGSILSKFDAWNSSGIEKLNPRFSYLIGTTYYATGLSEAGAFEWESALNNYEDALKQLVRRCFTGMTAFTMFEQISNISLPGYTMSATDEEEHAKIYNSSISALKAYLDLAADYGLKLYLYTDELVLTQDQYNWLMSNLNYSGEALKSDYPAHLHPDAPGLWTFIQAKYDAIVDSISTILTPHNKDAFGGFYFRTDDLYNPYPYKYSVFTTNQGFQRLINITCDAAARLNATAIHRVWRLGEHESVFNNATIAREILDPIQADNLVLRCKETWNDHWYNHPPNPVIGVSHHKWIIGWYTGAAMPDYKGSFYDKFFSEAKWESNPNIIGHDLPPLSYSSFKRLDYMPFLSANNHYLFMRMFYGEINGNQTLRRYFHQVGIGNETIIETLTGIFNKVHDAFRLISFWQAWASSGKFTGDVLNGGNTMLFEPGRFNKFYKAVRTSNYSIEYTIQEAYDGLELAEQAFNEFPSSYNGVPFPSLENGYLDPERASSSDNVTEQLQTLRGNLRQFRDFARIFAPYRAWHLMYYHWGETGSLVSWWRSEQYRNEVLDAYKNYMLVWGYTSYWYQVNFRQFGEYWLPLVGKTNDMRIGLLFVGIGLFAGAILMLYLYSSRWTRKQMLNTYLLGKVGKMLAVMKKKSLSKVKTSTARNDEEIDRTTRSNSEKINDNPEPTWKTSRIQYNTKEKLIGGIVLPGSSIAISTGLLAAVSLMFIPDLVIIYIHVLISFYFGALSVFFIFKKRQQVVTLGLTYAGTIISVVPALIMFAMGGLFIVTASLFMPIILISCVLFNLIYNAILITRNLHFKNKLLNSTVWLLITLISIGIFLLSMLFYGGVLNVLDRLLNELSMI